GEGRSLVNDGSHAVDLFVIADQIPDADEPAGDQAEQTQNRGDAAEEFKRLNVAHGAKDDWQRAGRVFPQVRSDAALAVLAHAANRKWHFDDSHALAEQVDEAFLGVGKSAEERHAIRGLAVERAEAAGNIGELRPTT